MKLLLVEDDKILSDTIKQVLKHQYDVDQVYSGLDASIMACRGIYDLIILDLMLPEMNGYEVLKELRGKGINTPVLILTAKDSVEDKVKGFDYGADDYLVKPFESKELIARIEAIIRRTKSSTSINIIRFKELDICRDSRKVKIEENEIFLQGKQFEMLEYLVENQNTIITKEQIFDKIWGFDSETSTNVVEVYASGIRKSLRKYGYDKYIKTVRGVGYMVSEK